MAEDRLDKVLEHLESLHAKIDGVDKKCESLHTRVDAMEKEHDKTKVDHVAAAAYKKADAASDTAPNRTAPINARRSPGNARVVRIE